MATGKYLGEFPVDVKESKFKDYTPFDWAMYFIERYGQIDGEHHKSWVLDQVSRIYNGTPVVVKMAKWDCGLEEYRVSLGESSEVYEKWVEEMIAPDPDDEDGCYYEYDPGIAP